ncbi:MAG: hypothetical protein GY940_23785 [bacterium]|nr:hypothetical protein [bacterium]
MEEKEKKELLKKIMNVENDPKMARVASTVFINKSSKEEAAVFLEYLENSNPAVKKIARSIVGQKGLVEACDILIKEYTSAVENLTFMPDEDTKESHYYSNLIEMLETIFAIAKNEKVEDEVFFNRIDEIFKKTKNEDLRFSLIKLMGVMGDRLDYFLEIYEDLTEKERRGLYYVYTFVDNPKRLEVYKRGLHDDRNFDYVIANMLNFDEGKVSLADQLLSLSSYNKQTVLKKLQNGRHPEFNDVLIKLLNDKNKFLVELSIENLKNNVSSDLSLDPFVELIETGYSPEGIQGALEIVAHFVRKNPEDIYIQGMEKQTTQKNKTIILEFFVTQLKTKIKPNGALTEKVLPKLLANFDTYAKDREDLFISVFKIIPSLTYSNSGELKAIKKKVISFKSEFEQRLSGPFKNNMKEFVVKLNQISARFEEGEAKIKNVVVLFDIDSSKIDHDRMVKLKDQLKDIETLDDETTERLIKFLVTMYDVSRIDWKIRADAVELLGDYGGLSVLPKMIEITEKESSLAVKVNAQKAVKKVEERNAAAIESVLVIEPLPFLQKKLNEFFRSKAFRVYNIDKIEKLESLTSKFFKFLVITDTLLNREMTPMVMEYLDENLDTILIIVTGRPEDMIDYEGLENVRCLKKPFNEATLAAAIV